MVRSRYGVVNIVEPCTICGTIEGEYRHSGICIWCIESYYILGNKKW